MKKKVSVIWKKKKKKKTAAIVTATSVKLLFQYAVNYDIQQPGDYEWIKVKAKIKSSYPCNRPWRPIVLWDVEAPIF
jgi:hypothetical protein